MASSMDAGRSVLEEPAENGFAAFAKRNEQAQAPGDDFADKADRLQRRNRTLAKARELDAVPPHDPGFAKRETVAKPDRPRLAQKKPDCGLGRKRSVLSVKPEGISKFGKVILSDEAADQPFALRRGEPEDAAALPGKLLPNR